MGNLFTVISDGGIPAYVIVIMGVFGIALIAERVKVLFFDFNLDADAFMQKIKSLVMGSQIEEAITFCDANKSTPFAHVIKGVLERSDRDDDGINQGLDIALAEVIPSLGKRLGYLAMIANVSTLVGLLGTITGLILSFEAVASAAADQKQEMLANGISMAMNTTALGLSVAIPVMICYAFLHSRQNHLLEEISEHSSKVVDLLTTRHYQPFEKEKLFPKDLEKNTLEAKSGVKPPPSNVKSA